MARITKLILLFLFLFSSNFVEAKSPPPGTGTTDMPANILIMLDNSGSMGIQLQAAVTFKYPKSVQLDSNGNIYIYEYMYRRVKVLDSTGKLIRIIYNSYGSGCNQYYYAFHMRIHNDQIYFADYTGKRIKVLSLTGQCIKQGYLSYRPQSMAVNGSYIYTYDHNRKCIDIYNNSSSINYNRSWCDPTRGYRVWDITSMALNSSNTVMALTDFGRNRVSVFNVSGANLSWSHYIGNGGTNYPTNNGPYSSSNGSFYGPIAVAIDNSGNFFVTDYRNNRVQKFNSSGSYVTKVGSYNNPWLQPRDSTTDASGNFYILSWTTGGLWKYNNSLVLQKTFTGRGPSRLDSAKKVIKKIVSNTDLTSGANFGLMEWGWYWNPYLRLRVPITKDGAKLIYNDVDKIKHGGGTYLYQAMIEARKYFTGPDSPRIPNATCQLNYIIVISDGDWQNHSGVKNITNQIRVQLGIKTFAVGFALGTTKTTYSDLAVAGGTIKPLYAENEEELLQKLTDAIKQALSGRLTFTTPAIMSDASKDDNIYQSTFEYSKNSQWKGSLKKYKLNKDGSFGNLDSQFGDAADKLNNKKSSDRNIFTTSLSNTTINNFTTSQTTELKQLMYPGLNPTNTEIENLINFVRGIDVYDEDSDGSTTDTRHKLADIYHSNINIVGPPNASYVNDASLNYNKKDSFYRGENFYNDFINGSTCGGPCKNRKEIILAGSNGGMLHAFDNKTGDELWAFIPPSLLRSLKNMYSSRANSSNSIYGVDGSPVVKDIYIDDTPRDNIKNPRWRTVAITGLGAGGHSYFILDITDTTTPKHLFTIENDASEQMINFWDSGGSITQYSYATGINPRLDYSKLGEAWSTPSIIRINVDGKDKWVAVFGGGYNGAVNPNYGSAVFVMELENEGKLIKVIDIEDQANVMHNYIFGTPSNNTQTEWALSNYGLQSYNVDCCSLKVYGAGSIKYSISGDLNGSTISNLKLKFDNPPPSNITLKISKVNKTDIVNSVPADLSVITADGTNKANYSGAMIYATDLEGKVTKINLTENFTLDKDSSNKTFNTIKKTISKTILFNTQSTSENGRYIYTRPEVTINSDNNLWLYFGTGDTQKLQTQSSKVKNRLYGIKDKNFPNFVEVNPSGDVSKCKTAPVCPGGNDLGWYIDLKNSQKLTAEPTIDKDRIYFPIYEPSSLNDPCKMGSAILMAFNTKCGNSVLNVNMGKGVLSKVVKQGDNLYIGLAGDANKNIAGFTSKDNLITGKSKAKSASGAVQLESWKENY